MSEVLNEKTTRFQLLSIIFIKVVLLPIEPNYGIKVLLKNEECSVIRMDTEVLMMMVRLCHVSTFKYTN